MENLKRKFELFHETGWKVWWPKFESPPTICGPLAL